MKNLIVRTLSGVGFVALVVAGLLLNQYTFLVLMLLILCNMMFEFLNMTVQKKYPFAQLLTIFAAVVLFVLTFLWQAGIAPMAVLLLAVVSVFFIMIDSLYVKDKEDFGKFSNLYTSLLYIAVPMSVVNFAVFSPEGGYDGGMLLCFFIIIWASDVGAYLFGCTLGQKYGKKLFPSISPKKSWVGFWGGFAMSIAVGIALHYIGALDLSILHSIALAVIIDVSGVYGDLVESQWKRHYGVKDSGKGIPGHGGYLDRFDSSLTAIPMGVIFLLLLNLL